MLPMSVFYVSINSDDKIGMWLISGHTSRLNMPAAYDISHMLLLFNSDMILEINLFLEETAELRWNLGVPKLIIDK